MWVTVRMYVRVCGGGSGRFLSIVHLKAKARTCTLNSLAATRGRSSRETPALSLTLINECEIYRALRCLSGWPIKFLPPFTPTKSSLFEGWAAIEKSQTASCIVRKV